jgi:hypothetical protein
MGVDTDEPDAARRAVMTRRFVILVVVLMGLAAVAPRAWGQFLSDEERKGMFSVSLGYSTRDYDMVFRNSSVPIKDIDAVFEAFSVKDKLDSVELNVAWTSFGYVELRGTLGLGDHNLENTHKTDSTFDTTFSTSNNLLYGVGATVRYPLTDWWLIALDVGFLTGKFYDIGGETAQLDVLPWLTTADVNNIDWRELTLTPMVQFRFGSFVPYVGAQLTKLTTRVNTTIQPIQGDAFDRIINYENADDWCAVVGLTCRITSLIMADVRAQLFNNTRFTVAIKFTF